MLLAKLIVVLTVARCDVDQAGAGFGGYEVRAEDLTDAIKKRMLVSKADEFSAFPRPGDLLRLGGRVLHQLRDERDT